MLYNLNILNDKEFEELSKDILEKELGISFQSFKKGKDKGIDLRFAQDFENQIIVQAKHYLNSRFSDLKFNLLNKEKQKIQKLKPIPKRYILITSLPLNPMEVDQLIEILNPFIKTSQDIFGLDRIESLITKYKDIEEKHFKLWLTSSNILKKILKNAITGRSEFYKNKILNKISLYVPTKNLDEAIEKLNKNKFILITGEPGIGKTTISYLLICDLLANGYQLIFIDDKLKDAEDVLSHNSEEKQIIYYDDFLGSNLYELINPRNTESTLIGFIERIQSLTNKLLILTTRTTILKQAESYFEKFNRSKLGKLSNYEVELRQYSKLSKAKILYNHLYHSDLTIDRFDIFYQNENYLKIIEHPNYSPRLIEFITSNNNFESAATQSEDFIFQNLENPHEIWKSAYENQLGDEERFLLLSLFTLGGYSVDHGSLESAFEARMQFEIEHNGFQRKNDVFNISLKKLLDGFIISIRKPHHKSNVFSYINPSIGDFLLNYLRQRKNEKLRIFKSLIFIEQFWYNFYPDQKGYLHLKDSELEKFFEIFTSISSSLIFTSKNKYQSKELGILGIYLTIFKDKLNEETILLWLKKIRISDVASSQFQYLHDILEIASDYDLCSSYVQDNWEDLIIQLYKIAKTRSDYDVISSLFNIYKKEITELMEKEEIYTHLVNSVNLFIQNNCEEEPDFENRIDEILESEFEGYTDHAESIIIEESLNKLSTFLEEIGLSEYEEYFDGQFDVDESSILNKLVQEATDVEVDYDPSFRHERDSPFTENENIKSLFDRS